jgi:ankyrin repeat protein
MTDWKTQQMIKASGWPLAPEDLAPGANFNARLADGLVPLHWACLAGKAGVVKHMLAHGADVHDLTANGQGMLELALRSKDFQTVMLVIDQLKAATAPPPTEAQKKQLTNAFSQAHTNAKNRMQQTLKDWDRIHKSATQAATHATSPPSSR